MAVGWEAFPLSSDSRREYAKRVGADYYEQTQRVHSCWSIYYLRLLLVESAFAAGYEAVFWLDGDAVVVTERALTGTLQVRTD